MPDAYSCFFDFTEASDGEDEAGPHGKPPHVPEAKTTGTAAPAAAAPASDPRGQCQSALVQALPELVLMDPEGKGVDVGEHAWVLEAMSKHFTTEGWVLIPKLGVPPQCRAKVQLEADILQDHRQAQRKAGVVLSNGLTNMAGSPAAIGHARTDRVLFLDFHAGGSSQGLREGFRGLFKLDEILERVVGQLTGQLQGSELGLQLWGRTRMMFACYEPGGYYLPHVDADEGDDRVLTAVYYLNQGWRREDGGALRLRPPGGGPHVDIWPEEDALVLFRADQMPHEVCVSSARRLAVTIWFKGLCGQVQADTNGTLSRTLALRRLPKALQASPFLAEAGSGWVTSTNDGLDQVGGVPAARRSAGNRADSSDSDGPSHRESTQPRPVLVCWNIVGFTLQQGKERLAGLFVAVKQLGIRDHVVLSYPEDHGIEGDGSSEWANYVDRLVEAIDQKPRHRGRPLLLFAHSTAGAAALCVASRLGQRVLKLYMVDCGAPEPGGYDFWAGVTADFRTWSDARWMVQLAAWNPGSTVLREMATAAMGGWDVSKSKGAQELLRHGKKQYLNAIHPELGRDLEVVPAPILVFSMVRDEVVPLQTVRWLERWTSGGFQLEMFDSTHMGWLEPTADKATNTHRCHVFDRIRADVAANLQRWGSLGLC